MSLNDTNLGVAQGSDVHPGVANPTKHSKNANPLSRNFVDDPTTEEKGAGAGSNFQGHKDAARSLRKTSRVIHGGSGILETCHIDPLNDSDSPDNDSAAQYGSGNGMPDSAKSAASGGASMAGGAAKLAYGTVIGDDQMKKAGNEAVRGERA